MGETGTAYFIRRPNRATKLTVPHLLTNERPFEIVHTILLPAIDYENFINDMLVEREYIEECAGLCERGDVWKCLFIGRKNRRKGVLVMPEGGLVVWAAAYKQTELTR